MDVSIVLPPRFSHDDNDIRAFVARERASGKTNAEIRKAIDELPRTRPTKKQAEVEAAKGDDAFLDSLGIEVIGQHENGGIEVFSAKTRRSYVIRDISRLSIPHLIQFAGETIETKVCEGPDAHGMRSLRLVRNLIAKSASKLPTMDSASKRGAGCWLGDDGDSIILVGDREISIVNGKAKVERTDKPRIGKFIYRLDGNPPWFTHAEFSKSIATVDSEQVVEDALGIIRRWNWSFDSAPELFLGLWLATWPQTVWSWRPQVVITGEASTGKSILFRMLKHAFAGLATKTASNTTPVGLMQEVGHSAKIILVDELDKNRHREEIVEMVRASGRGDDTRITGTASGRAIRTKLQQTFWMAGIESGLITTTDAERFVRLELLPRRDDAAKLREPSLAECESLGSGLLAVSIRHSHEAINLANQLAATDLRDVPTRVVETYSVPAAMYALAAGLSPRGVLESFVANHEKHSVESDSDSLISAILGAHVDAGHSLGRRSVEQLLRIISRRHSIPSGLEDAESSLEKCGIEISENGRLRLNQTDIARHLLQKTPWAKSKFSEVLLRMKNSEAVRTKKKRFVEVDFDVFCPEIGKKEENGDSGDGW